MKNSMKYLPIIVVMIMMMLAACAQENTSDSGESAKTGIVGKWKTTNGTWICEFKSDGTLSYQDGTTGEWLGNDVSGELRIFGTDTTYWYYQVSGNNMTMTNKEYDMDRIYFTRM